MATESEARDLMFALLKDALVHARIVGRFPEQPESVPTVTEVVNLFHNGPMQLRDLDDKTLTGLSAIQILERTRSYAEGSERLARWLQQKIEDHGFAGG
jgi:hypothetical protein